jgi:hypoxanthine phosphoribosyltransferase
MPDKLKVFISPEEIDQLNSALAQRIEHDYRKVLAPGENILVVVTLKGAAFFATDLLKKIQLPMVLDFVRLSSYGAGTKSSGTVHIIKDMETSPTDRHVLVLDEIVDSGRTLAFLRNRIQAANPKTLKLCGLLNKPSRREVEIDVDYLGRDVEDKFLVGYGLDKAEMYRNLPAIYSIE